MNSDTLSKVFEKAKPRPSSLPEIPLSQVTTRASSPCEFQLVPTTDHPLQVPGDCVIKIPDDEDDLSGDKNTEVVPDHSQDPAFPDESGEPDRPQQISEDGTGITQGDDSSAPFLGHENKVTENQFDFWKILRCWKNMPKKAKFAIAALTIVLMILVGLLTVLLINQSRLKMNGEEKVVVTDERSYAQTCHSNKPCPQMNHTRFCDEMCPTWKSIRDPTDAKLLQTLSLDPHFAQVLISSSGLGSLSRATGPYRFVGEFGGTPVFQNILTGLYYYFIEKGGVTYWQVGPSYKTSRAVIEAVSSSKSPEIDLQENGLKRVLDEHNVYQTDETITIKPYRDIGEIDCTCSLLRLSYEYQLKHFPVRDLEGDYRKNEELRQQLGLSTPVYHNKKSGLIVYSTQPLGQVWFISYKDNLNIYNKALARAVTPSCPEDGKNQDWALLMINTTVHQEYYGKEESLKMECVI